VYNIVMRIPALLFLAMALLGGCTRYEYDLLEPADRPTRIGRSGDVVIPIEPLEYHLRTVDGRLMMRIFNRSEDPIQLIGAASTAVDPKGQSHPLPSFTIAPGSFGKLIFPPPRPRIERGGPSFGVGVGVGVSSARHPAHRHGYLHSDREPRYLVVYDDASALYWDWQGETTAKINIAYERDEETWRHPFVFKRVKAK
jgi:hypothetical protein